jgi:hypothetical protein
MDTLTKRKRGGQPGNKNAVGNQNAVNHGRYTAAARAAREARWAVWRAEWQERERRSALWIAAQPKTDYGRIIDELKRLRREQEAAERAAMACRGSKSQGQGAQS